MVTFLSKTKLKSVDPIKVKRIERLRKTNQRPSNGTQTKRVSLGYRDFSFL